MTKVTFHFSAEPQVSEETRRWHNTTVAVKIGLLSSWHCMVRCHSKCWNHFCVQSRQIRQKSTARQFPRGQGWMVLAATLR
ncbi:unnamed protein product [Ixodes pacificus]